MENLDEKHVDILRTGLSVYEVEGIQCQLTFQKKTITLDVSCLFSSHSFFFSEYSSRQIAVHVHLKMRKIKFHYISKNKSENLIILILPVN
jgi:hypothetical protein